MINATLISSPSFISFALSEISIFILSVGIIPADQKKSGRRSCLDII
jgi:hypothetical protein